MGAIKIRKKPSFGGKIKPEAQCHKILWNVTKFYEYERYIS
jgi:hypothetical protein